MKTIPRLLAAAVLLLLPHTLLAADLPAKFDPARNAAGDVATATSLAMAQRKRVLVDDNYVWVKVNWSPQNKNEALLARWPEVKGFPHLFVLDGEGALLHSQDTGALEAGDSYDKEKVLAFLQKFRRP